MSSQYQMGEAPFALVLFGMVTVAFNPRWQKLTATCTFAYSFQSSIKAAWRIKKHAYDEVHHKNVITSWL